MKLIVVTGGTQGLGLKITEMCLKEQYKVIAIGRTLSEGLSELIQQFPEHCHYEAYDLVNTDGIHKLSTQLVKKYGRVYGLINNAAIGSDGILATMHELEIQTLIKVNIEAPILLCKYLMRSMLINQTGRIINISSIIAKTGFKGLAVYGASKAALEGLTSSLCREVGQAGITVNNVAPGYMETQMTQSLTGDKLASIKRRSPSGQLATVEDVACAVIFLLKESSASITGSTITVDAGSTA